VFLSNRSERSEPLVDFVRFAKVPTDGRSSRRPPGRFTKKEIILSAMGSAPGFCRTNFRFAPTPNSSGEIRHNRESTGNFLAIGRSAGKTRLENIYDFRYLLDDQYEIPCAPEQGINSRSTGK
jgi:hypothetical protein